MVVDVRTRAPDPPVRRVPSQPRRRRGDHPLIFIVPAFAVLAVFFVLPTVFNFVYAFTDWSSFKAQINFVGLENVRSLIKSGTSPMNR